MRAEDLMNPEVVSLDAEATVGDALAAFTEHGVRHLPIVRAGQVLAMISDRDLRRVEGLLAQQVGHADCTQNVLDAPVTSLVSGPPVTARRDTPVDELIDRLLDEGVGALVVVDDAGALQGIVSYVDVLAAARGKLG